MDMLKKFFPYSFGAKDITNLIVKIIVYIVVGAVMLDVMKKKNANKVKIEKPAKAKK